MVGIMTNARLLSFLYHFPSLAWMRPSHMHADWSPRSHAWMRHVTLTCLRADRACGREGRRSQEALWKGGRGSQQALAAPRPKRAAEGPCGRGHGFSICGARRHRAEPAAKEIWMVLGRVVAYYAQNCRWIHAPRIRGTRSFRIHQIRGPRGRGPRGRGSSPA